MGKCTSVLLHHLLGGGEIDIRSAEPSSGGKVYLLQQKDERSHLVVGKCTCVLLHHLLAGMVEIDVR